MKNANRVRVDKHKGSRESYIEKDMSDKMKSGEKRRNERSFFYKREEGK